VPDRSIYPQAAVDLVDFYISDFGGTNRDSFKLVQLSLFPFGRLKCEQ
jgi:hypothetical protein